MTSLDRLCGRSRLREENAATKFAFAAVTLCICAASRSMPAACAAFAAAGYLTVRRGGLPLRKYLRLLTLPLAFLLLSTAAILVQVERTPLDLFALPLGEWVLTGSRASLRYAAQLIFTSMACVSCLYFLTLTTPVTDILGVLRRLHCPALVMELMLLIYRFLFLLQHTALAISIAQQCRLGNRDYPTALRSFGQLGTVLMVRAVGRANRLYNAMEARCYQGVLRVLPETQPPKPKAVAGVVLFDGALLLLAAATGGVR